MLVEADVDGWKAMEDFSTGGVGVALLSSLMDVLLMDSGRSMNRKGGGGGGGGGGGLELSVKQNK